MPRFRMLLRCLTASGKQGEASGHAVHGGIQFTSILTYIQITSAKSLMQKETISYHHHLFS